MGRMRHHAIVVTSWNHDAIRGAQTKARLIFGERRVSDIIESSLNDYWSFFVPPDGSKEGWKESDEGDRRRAEFVEYLDEVRYEDGSTSLSWVEVQYGDDGRDTRVVNDSDARRRGA